MLAVSECSTGLPKRQYLRRGKSSIAEPLPYAFFLISAPPGPPSSCSRPIRTARARRSSSHLEMRFGMSVVAAALAGSSDVSPTNHRDHHANDCLGHAKGGTGKSTLAQASPSRRCKTATRSVCSRPTRRGTVSNWRARRVEAEPAVETVSDASEIGRGWKLSAQRRDAGDRRHRRRQ